MIDLESLRKNYLVQGLNDEQLACLQQLAAERRLAPGELLCRAGEPGGEMFIVMDGLLEVQTAEGKRLAEVGPNTVLGEMGLIGSRPRSASVRALTEVRLAAIDSADLHGAMIEDAQMGFLVLYNITRLLSDRLRNADVTLSAMLEAA